jgi:hypothetical protein
MPSEDLDRHHDQKDITQEYSFDELAKGVADGTLSRLQVLKLLAGTLLGGSLLTMFAGPAKAQLLVANTGNAQNIDTIVDSDGIAHRDGNQETSQPPAKCPPERVCTSSNRCCPPGEICAPGGGVCCPRASVCTVGGVPEACCAGLGTCINGVCVSFA